MFQVSSDFDAKTLIAGYLREFSHAPLSLSHLFCYYYRNVSNRIKNVSNSLFIKNVLNWILYCPLKKTVFHMGKKFWNIKYRGWSNVLKGKWVNERETDGELREQNDVSKLFPHIKSVFLNWKLYCPPKKTALYGKKVLKHQTYGLKQ